MAFVNGFVVHILNRWMEMMLYISQIHVTNVFHLVTVAYCILESVPVGCEDEGVPHFLIPV